MKAHDVTVSAPRKGDKEAWRALYDGYAAFYKRPMNDEIADTVWRWLHDPDHVVKAFLARTETGRIVGLAHYRPMPRPLAGTECGFLDDLFVAPDMRGNGVAGALFDALAGEAKKRGWSQIRWLTCDDNYRARSLYDRRAKRTMWLTYQMDL
jgi:GNAT superfamily N-acetyltransferase